MKILTKILTITAVLILPLSAKAAIMPRGLDGNFTLKFQDQTFELAPSDLSASRGIFNLPGQSNLAYQPPTSEQTAADFFGAETGAGKNPNQTFHYNPSDIYNFVRTAANAIEKPAAEPELKIEDGKAVSFLPPADGVSIDAMETTLTVLNNLENDKSYADVTYATTSPSGKLAETNNLGINELIAHGVSNYKGSPKNRIHNIQVGVEKFKGVIIPQGAEFSFNKNLGPVEKEEGFLPELVIKKEGTIPELGGGLCQVSSTTFRAAMEAGLPITQRRNHAYAVQYYSPQGTDATIYPGVVDLKFINDTPGAILVWPHFEEGSSLIFDFYGTKDDRQVTLEKPIQYDRKTDGSMKAEWTRIIEKDGVTSSSTFKSIYQSPALFHKTESFVSASSTPAVKIN